MTTKSVFVIDGIDYDVIPNYLVKDGFQRPVTSEFFTIGTAEREIPVIPEPEVLTTLKAALANKVASLNSKYVDLNLLVSDQFETAISKLFANNVTEEDTVFLNTLYQTIKQYGISRK